MRITFDNAQINAASHEGNKVNTPDYLTNVSAYDKSVPAASFNKGDNLFAKDREDKKTLSDIQSNAEGIDTEAQENMGILLSNTLSPEEYEKAAGDGFDLSDMNEKETVTIVDKIKAELIRSGKHIAGFTDDCDTEVLAEVFGSMTLAMDLASNLTPLSDEAKAFMIENDMEPTIENIYMAENTTAKRSLATAPAYLAQSVTGYFTKTETVSDIQLEADAQDVLKKNAMEDNDENLQMAKFFVREGLLTDNSAFESYEKLSQLNLPPTDEEVNKAVENALFEGKAPIRANLAQSENIYEKADRIYKYYMDKDPLLLDNIIDRRKLEEVRLRMTAEVNVKLIRSGFSIETAPMDALIEALKQAEKEVAESLFGNEPGAELKYELFNHVNDIISKAPSYPIDIVGSAADKIEHMTLSDFENKSEALKREYEAANTEYEKLMTAPNAELGDSIKKAFANVDDILSDLGLSCDEDNERAVRILGYNKMAITPEHIDSIKEAYNEVTEVTGKFTPAATLKLIRDGINPLAKSFDELRAYFKENESFDEKAVSFSKYLVSLEQNKSITDSERDGYIGIYRLINKIEKADSSVIGAVVNAGMELNFENLLSAKRSNRAKNMDIKISDEFGSVIKLIKEGKTISEQIAGAFVNGGKQIIEAISDEEAYQAKDYEAYKNILQNTQEAYDVLRDNDINATPLNAKAFEMLTQSEEAVLNRLFEKSARLKKTSIAEAKKSLEGGRDFIKLMDSPDQFEAEYKDYLSKLSEETEELTLEAADNSIDVRELRLINKALSVAGSLSEKEKYFFPIETKDGTININLSVEHKEGKGQIAIHTDDATGFGALLSVSDKILGGFVYGNSDSDVNKITKAVDIFINQINSSDYEIKAGRIEVIRKSHYEQLSQSEKNMEVPGANESTDTQTLLKIAGALLKSII